MSAKSSEKFKTAIIWNSYDSIRYYVIESDLRKFHGVMINSVNDDDELQDELSGLFYHPETGDSLQKPVEIDEFAEAIRYGAYLIECGFIP